MRIGSREIQRRVAIVLIVVAGILLTTTTSYAVDGPLPNESDFVMGKGEAFRWFVGIVVCCALVVLICRWEDRERARRKGGGS